MTSVYVLELNGGKYYVGKTNDTNKRIQDHLDGNGAAWTRLHKPIKVVKVMHNCDDYDENKVTLQYMNKYGIDNVRGGPFVSVELDDNDIDVIKRMNRGSNDKCFNCGKYGHYANECNKGYACNKGYECSRDIVCYRCDRYGHYANECYAKYHADGYKLY